MTATDTNWTNRLKTIMPANFDNNVSETFTATANKIFTNLINRIGRTVCYGVDSPYNPFAKYTKEIMDFGDTIQDIKSVFVKGNAYNPEATTPFATNKNNPMVQYEKYNDAIQYLTTIYDNQAKMAFTSEQQYGDFASNQLDALMQSDALDKRTKWKKYLTQETVGGNAMKATQKQTVTLPLNATQDDTDKYYLNILKEIKNFCEVKFVEPSPNYNWKGDIAITPKADVILRRDVKLGIDMALKNVYNLTKVDVDANFLYVDDFATPTSKADIGALIIDPRAIEYVPRTPVTTSMWNPQALNTNYFLTIQGIYAIDMFRNFARIDLDVAKV